MPKRFQKWQNLQLSMFEIINKHESAFSFSILVFLKKYSEQGLNIVELIRTRRKLYSKTDFGTILSQKCKASGETVIFYTGANNLQ